MNKKTFFISDLHLDERYSRTTRLFLNFLTQLDKTVDALYILGDFFDSWIGDDDVSEFHLQIQSALKKASEVCPVYFLPGNRDFLVGHRFAENTGCILLEDPVVVNLYGVRTLLTHGDSLCIHDVRHLRFRAISQHPLVRFLFLKLPIKIRKKVAQMLRGKSRQHLKYASKTLWNIPESEVFRIMTHFKVRQMIQGHTHEHRIYAVELKDGVKGQRVVLGDWENSDSIMVCQPNMGQNDFLTENKFKPRTFVNDQ